MTRLPKKVSNLHTSYNNIYENLDHAFCVSDVLKKDGSKEPEELVDYGKVDISFEEAITGLDAENWKEAINAEMNNWKQCQVFKIINIKDVLKNKN